MNALEITGSRLRSAFRKMDEKEFLNALCDRDFTGSERLAIEEFLTMGTPLHSERLGYLHSTIAQVCDNLLTQNQAKIRQLMTLNEGLLEARMVGFAMGDLARAEKASI